MSEWWQGLSEVNRIFYCIAAFCSVFFVWQLIAALIGLGDGDVDFDTDADVGADGLDLQTDHTYHHFEHGAQSDAVATMAAFKLLSVRSIVTFVTLFSWGCALYLDYGYSVSRAMGISTLWGLAGMLSVAAILFALPKLAHTGNKQIASCVGAPAAVYLNIPANGIGEIRVMMSGIVSFVKARSADGTAIPAGAAVKVTRILDASTVEVTAA